MSFEIVGLGKLLNALYADRADCIAILRQDIRDEIKKDAGGPSGDGGDFYIPFWSDAKRHVSNEHDLRTATAARIEKNKSRSRLYPRLAKGFLLWWEQTRRLRNIPFTVIPGTVKARFTLEGGVTVKVENTMAITVGDDGHRIIYPYFYDVPALSDEAARIGLWVMCNSIKGYNQKDMRLLDVIRGRTFSELDTPLLGDEEAIFRTKLAALLELRAQLRTEYN